jgi:hypothetical protein
MVPRLGAEQDVEARLEAVLFGHPRGLFGISVDGFDRLSAHALHVGFITEAHEAGSSGVSRRPPMAGRSSAGPARRRGEPVANRPAAAFGLVQHAERQSIGQARRRGAAAGGCLRRHSCRASGLRAYIGADDDMDRNYMRRADILGCFARRPFGRRVASNLSG